MSKNFLTCLSTRGFIYTELMETPGAQPSSCTPTSQLCKADAPHSSVGPAGHYTFQLKIPVAPSVVLPEADSELALPTRYKYPRAGLRHYLPTGFINLTVSHPALNFFPPPCLKYFEASPSLPIWAKTPFRLLENSPAERVTRTEPLCSTKQASTRRPCHQALCCPALWLHSTSPPALTRQILPFCPLYTHFGK